MAVRRKSSKAAAASPGAGLSRDAARPTAPQELLRLEPRPWFTLLHHIAQWDVFTVGDGLTVAPRLVEFYYQAGVSGVVQLRKQLSGDATSALAWKGRQGWREIAGADSRTVVAFGAEVRGYVGVYDGHKGPIHVPRWRRPLRLPGRVRWEYDTEGRVAFAASLVDSGEIAPMLPHVGRALALTLRGQRDKYSSRRDARNDARADIYSAKLEALEAYMAARAAA
tara:strand:+ start:546 stop:1217 length:672 start_codon:yes stop_codon:yes gene_type:complete